MSRQVSMTTLGMGMLGAVIVGAAAYHLVIANIDGNVEEPYPVQLTPEKDGVLSVLVKKDKQKCKNADNKGCLRFGDDHTGAIKFYLKGSKRKNKSCSSNSGVKEVITKIELTTTVDRDSSNKGDFDKELKPWIKTFAFTGVDLKTGIVYQATRENGRTQVFLPNMNSHDADEGTKLFWYRVTASACDESGEQWVTDPRGENKGMN